MARACWKQGREAIELWVSSVNAGRKRERVSERMEEEAEREAMKAPGECRVALRRPRPERETGRVAWTQELPGRTLYRSSTAIRMPKSKSEAAWWKMVGGTAPIR